MASPINITTTPIVIVIRNNRRDRLILQNQGKIPVYIKRQPTNLITDIPSDTNYDFILYPPKGNDQATITKINSVACYAAVVVENGNDKNSDISVMQTIIVDLI